MKISVQPLFSSFFRFHHTCPLCEQKFVGNLLCDSCKKLLPHVHFFCQMCGIPLPQTSICGQCLIKPPLYRYTFPCFWYEEPLQTLIQAYKFNQKIYLAPVLGALMAEKIDTYYSTLTYPECIIPMPIHPKRLGERGYHQVYELSKILSKKLSIPVHLNTCQRVRHSLPQSRVPVSARKNNVHQAFSAQKISYQHIALIDDVMTTGETVSALSQALKKENPEIQIEVWCLARTKPFF